VDFGREVDRIEPDRLQRADRLEGLTQFARRPLELERL
jgi:hypothetical protein